MARLQLGSYLDDDSLEVGPIPSKAHPDGRMYTIASPSAKDGLRLASLASLAFKANAGTLDEKAAEDLQLDDEDERNLYKLALGDTYQEMLDDGVSWVRIQRLGMYLFLHYGVSAEVAEATLGEAAAPNRATRRAKAPSRSTSRGSRDSSPTKARTRKA